MMKTKRQWLAILSVIYSSILFGQSVDYKKVLFSVVASHKINLPRNLPQDQEQEAHNSWQQIKSSTIENCGIPFTGLFFTKSDETRASRLKKEADKNNCGFALFVELKPKDYKYKKYRKDSFHLDVIRYQLKQQLFMKTRGWKKIYSHSQVITPGFQVVQGKIEVSIVEENPCERKMFDFFVPVKILKIKKTSDQVEIVSRIYNKFPFDLLSPKIEIFVEKEKQKQYLYRSSPQKVPSQKAKVISFFMPQIAAFEKQGFRWYRKNICSRSCDTNEQKNSENRELSTAMSYKAKGTKKKEENKNEEMLPPPNKDYNGRWEGKFINGEGTMHFVIEDDHIIEIGHRTKEGRGNQTRPKGRDTQVSKNKVFYLKSCKVIFKSSRAAVGIMYQKKWIAYKVVNK